MAREIRREGLMKFALIVKPIVCRPQSPPRTHLLIALVCAVVFALCDLVSAVAAPAFPGAKQMEMEFRGGQAFTFKLPYTWTVVAPAMLEQWERQTRQIASSGGAGMPEIERFDYAYQYGGYGKPLEFPLILVKVNDTGRLPERMFINAVKPGYRTAEFAEANGAIGRIVPGMGISEAAPPQYDSVRHRLWLVMQLDAGDQKILAFSATQLTEKGYIRLYGYSTEADFPYQKPIYERALETLVVSKALQYQPRWTDAGFGTLLVNIAGSALGGLLIGFFVYLFYTEPGKPARRDGQKLWVEYGPLYRFISAGGILFCLFLLIGCFQTAGEDRAWVAAALLMMATLTYVLYRESFGRRIGYSPTHIFVHSPWTKLRVFKWTDVQAVEWENSKWRLEVATLNDTFHVSGMLRGRNDFIEAWEIRADPAGTVGPARILTAAIPENPPRSLDSAAPN
jgi:hypothetical protein